MLQQQLQEMLKGLYQVQVFVGDTASQYTTTSSSSSMGGGDFGTYNYSKQQAQALWTGNVLYDGSSSSSSSSTARAGAVRLMRKTTTATAHSRSGRAGSMPQFWWKDNLTVISKPGINQVRNRTISCNKSNLVVGHASGVMPGGRCSLHHELPDLDHASHPA